MSLWVFGDSYAQQYSNLQEQWMQLVANDLNTELKCFGLVGSSAEFTYDSFNKVRNNIKDNDVVILVLTTHSRRWFFKDYPNHTAQPAPGTSYKEPVSIYDPTGFEEVDEALKLYEDCLNNQLVSETYLQNFLYNLDNLTKKLNLHTIVIPNFYDTVHFLEDKKNLYTNLTFAQGMTVDVSLNEFTKDYLIEYTTSVPDVRVNHFIKSNHKILANKILNNIKYKKDIDLSTEFIKHTFSKDKITNKEFVEDQLFQGILL